MTEGEIVELIDVLALDPMAGEEIKGTGGCRKLRLAGRGKGKSGGYRTITSYSGSELPVFLITVFSKGERSDLTKADQNGLAKLTKELVEIYRAKVVRYSAYVTTRNCFGLMTRKVSVTALVNSRHLLGTSSRRKPRVASAKSL